MNRPAPATETARASMGPSTRTGGCAADEKVLADGIQLGALVEQDRVGGVEVLRSGVLVLQLRVTAADEAEGFELAVGSAAGDGEDDAVAEPVDEPARAGGRGQTGLGELEVAGAVAAKVTDEVGPAGRGVPGADVGVAGEVDPDTVDEVALRPGPGETGGVVIQCEPVELENPGLADGCGVGVVGAGELHVDLPVGGR